MQGRQDEKVRVAVSVQRIARRNGHLQTLSQSLELDLGNAKVKERGLNQVLSLVFDGITNSAAAKAATALAANAEV